MSSSKKYDYIVVGQGLAGTLIVHDLLEKDKSVLIIDSILDASASRVAAGLINPISVRRCIPAFSEEYIEKAFKRYLQLEKKLNSDFLHVRSLIKIFRNSEIQNLWKDKFTNFGMDLYIKGFNNENSFNFLNDDYQSANVEPSGNLNVSKFLDVSKRYFLKTCDFVDDVFSFSEFNDEKISYKNYKSEKIIFCEGYRIKENPFFKYLPISPTKGEIMTIKIPTIEFFDKIFSKGVYIIPLGNFLYRVGATFNRVDLSDRVTKDGKQFLIERLEGIINVDYEIVKISAGVRPTVKDYKPLIGWHPKNQNIGVFNGLGARGVLAGPFLSDAFVNSSFETISRFN